MLLGEPPRTPYDLNFALFGFPVRIHPFFWLIGLFLAVGPHTTPAVVLTWIVALLSAILVHELGHATVMRAYGYSPWITLYALGGLATPGPSYSVGPRAQTPLAHVLISLAGPGAGFLLAAVLVAGIKLSGHAIEFGFGGDYGIRIAMGEIGSPIFRSFLFQVLFISTIWGLVNLLPIYPLDGGQIARELFLVADTRSGIRRSLMLSLFVAGGMVVFGIMRRDFFVAILFGFLAFENYAALKSYGGHGGGW